MTNVMIIKDDRNLYFNSTLIRMEFRNKVARQRENAKKFFNSKINHIFGKDLVAVPAK